MANFIYKHRKTNKRYMLIFQVWNNKKSQITYSEYDTLSECNEEIELIKECYKDTPKYVHDINPDGMFWGYALLDFANENVLKWGNDCINGFNKRTDKKFLKDHFFRKEGEVPEKYQWDDGEYNGWLQFRWGDGKNAIGYVEKVKPIEKDKNIVDDKQPLDEADYIQNEYDKLAEKEELRLKIERW